MIHKIYFYKKFNQYQILGYEIYIMRPWIHITDNCPIYTLNQLMDLISRFPEYGLHTQYNISSDISDDSSFISVVDFNTVWNSRPEIKLNGGQFNINMFRDDANA